MLTNTRIPLAATAVAAVALIAACGSNSPTVARSSDTRPGPTSRICNRQSSVSATACALTVCQLPQPDNQSPRFQSRAGSKHHQSPAFQPALTACGHLLPGGGLHNQTDPYSPRRDAALLALPIACAPTGSRISPTRTAAVRSHTRCSPPAASTFTTRRCFRPPTHARASRTGSSPRLTWRISRRDSRRPSLAAALDRSYTPRPGERGTVIAPSMTGNGEGSPSKSSSVARPHGGSGASAAAACSAAAMPSGPSKVEEMYASAPLARDERRGREQAPDPARCARSSTRSHRRHVR